MSNQTPTPPTHGVPESSLRLSFNPKRPKRNSRSHQPPLTTTGLQSPHQPQFTTTGLQSPIPHQPPFTTTELQTPTPHQPPFTTTGLQPSTTDQPPFTSTIAAPATQVTHISRAPIGTTPLHYPIVQNPMTAPSNPTITSMMPSTSRTSQSAVASLHFSPPPNEMGIPQEPSSAMIAASMPTGASHLVGIQSRPQVSSSALKQKQGRGLNKGDPMRTNEEDKIVIDIDPITNRFVQKKRIVRTIGRHVKLELEEKCFSWTKATVHQKRRFWKAFKSTYRWPPEHDEIVQFLWTKAIIKSMNNCFSRMHTKWKKKKQRAKWIADELWEGFLQYWESDEFKARSKAGKDNRAKGPSITHTTGSQDIVDFEKQLAKATGCTSIPQDQVYMLTRVHRPKGELTIDPNVQLQWVNQTSKHDYDKYVEHCQERYGEDRSTWPHFDAEGWVKATGIPKKGKVRGIPCLADPEDYNIPVPRRRTFFQAENSLSAEMLSNVPLIQEARELLSTYEARERESAEERRRLEEEINKLKEQLSPQYVQRVIAEQFAQMRQAERMQQDEAFQHYLGSDMGGANFLAGKSSYPQAEQDDDDDDASEDGELNY